MQNTQKEILKIFDIAAARRSDILVNKIAVKAYINEDSVRAVRIANHVAESERYWKGLVNEAVNIYNSYNKEEQAEIIKILSDIKEEQHPGERKSRKAFNSRGLIDTINTFLETVQTVNPSLIKRK